MEFHDCPCSGKWLQRLVQPAVMAMLAEEPMHGYRIVQRMRELAMFREQRPDPTGVYRVLKTMEDEELVSSDWDLAESGPARRRFKLTARGRKCLRRWIQTISDYQAGIEELLGLARQLSRRG